MELNGRLTSSKGAFTLIKKPEMENVNEGTGVQKPNNYFAEAGLIRHEYSRKQNGEYSVTIKNLLH